MKTSRIIWFLLALVIALGVVRFEHRHGIIAAELERLKSHKVTVQWNASPGAQSYNIYRTTLSGRNYVKIGSSMEPRYVDQAVDSDTVYYYAVTAVMGNGVESAFSAEIKAPVP